MSTSPPRPAAAACRRATASHRSSNRCRWTGSSPSARSPSRMSPTIGSRKKSRASSDTRSSDANMAAVEREQFIRHYVAVVTPFKDNFDVDETAFKDAGAAIIINPEAGELLYLNRDEKRRNVEIAVEECGGKVPVFAGAIDLRTEDAVKVAVDAREAGANGLFLLPPIGMMDITSCWDPERYPEIWLDLAKAQTSAAGLPAIVHPVAGRTPTFGIGLPLAPALLMCREIPEIVGWKMTYSYEGTKIVAKALKNLERKVAVLIATGRYFHDHLATGILEGTLSGSYNYAMEPMMAHLAAWKNDDPAEASRIWNSGLYDLHAYIYSDYSRLHVRYKLATWLRGLD